jgi:coiled-coil domain-containing protein 63/114
VQEIDELIEKFKVADDENYTLFTYVIELNQEITKLEEQVKAIEEEIEEAQKQGVAFESCRRQSQQEVRP